MGTETLRELFYLALEMSGDAEFVAWWVDENLSLAVMDKRFVNDHGCGLDVDFDEVKVFAWSARWVFYVVDYDDILSVEAAPRNPL